MVGVAERAVAYREQAEGAKVPRSMFRCSSASNDCSEGVTVKWAPLCSAHYHRVHTMGSCQLHARHLLAVHLDLVTPVQAMGSPVCGRCHRDQRQAVQCRTSTGASSHSDGSNMFAGARCWLHHPHLTACASELEDQQVSTRCACQVACFLFAKADTFAGLPDLVRAVGGACSGAVNWPQ